jgi:hypothetical protein
MGGCTLSKWIISSHKSHKHKTFEAAKKEAERLSTQEGKTFRIYEVMETTEIMPHKLKTCACGEMHNMISELCPRCQVLEQYA